MKNDGELSKVRGEQLKYKKWRWRWRERCSRRGARRGMGCNGGVRTGAVPLAFGGGKVEEEG